MTTNTRCRAIVKQIVSGDCIVVRGRAQGGPPPERTISFANIVAPKLARKADTYDEPFAWQAREHLRTKAIGKEVEFVIENTSQQGREYGNVFLVIPTGSSTESLSESLVAAGLAEVRRINNAAAAAGNEVYQKLLALEEAARSQNRGKWCEDEDPSKSQIRQIIWKVDNITQFVERFKNIPLDGIIEHIRDGSSYRVSLLPNEKYQLSEYVMISLILSGVRSPSYKLDGDSQVAEEYAEEAKYFVESRLLQRQVSVHLESSSGQSFVGSVLHPNGNIAQLVLQNGLAFCVDWSMGVVSSPGGAEALRSAEREAKEKKLRYWKNHVASMAFPVHLNNSLGLQNDSSNASTAKGHLIVGKVTEVGNGDSIIVKCSHDGKSRRFFFSSLRPPRLNAQPNAPSQPKIKPLYDIPYMFEAREFLRKKLVGRKVTLYLDYVQPPNQEGQDERQCATVLVGNDVNVAETIIAKGLASVVKYRPGDDKRSRAYDQLLAAEAVAQKKAVGIHSKKPPAPHRIVDLSGDSTKSKNFLPFLKRGGKLEAVVEFVVTASRFRVYVPRETCLITFLCAGIECAKPPRHYANGTEDKGEPFGKEALEFAKENVLQREVDIEVDTIDKAGNFIGWVFMKNSLSDVIPQPTNNSTTVAMTLSNYSVALVENGFATIHFSASKSPYISSLTAAEEKARDSQIGLWSIESFRKQNQVDEINNENTEKLQTSSIKNSTTQEINNLKKSGIVLATKNELLKFCILPKSNLTTFQKIGDDLRAYMSAHTPVPGAYTPTKNGDMCAALYSLDNSWYRAKILKIARSSGALSSVQVVFVDFGNIEQFNGSEISKRLATLPSELSSIPPAIKEYKLAGVCLHPEEDEKQTAEDFLMDSCLNLEVDYVPINSEYAILYTFTSESASKQVDLAYVMIREGFVTVDKKAKYLPEDITKHYESAQNSARQERRQIWQYGDFTGDD